MSETLTCTCIKPLVINGQRLSVGDEINLVESQARPLQNGGFVTLDIAAGELIRELLQEDSEAEVDIDISEGEVAEVVTENERSEQRSDVLPRQPNPTQIGYEAGD